MHEHKGIIKLNIKDKLINYDLKYNSEQQPIWIIRDIKLYYHRSMYFWISLLYLL